MIKGCNKRVIVMKDTGNSMIEEAFFILKADAIKEALREEDIIKQANKILEKSMCDEEFSCFKAGQTRKKSKNTLSSFLLGGVFGALLMAGIVMVL